jgi:hypothetical protein
MTVALLQGVMTAAVFRIRFLVTIRLLELMLRIMFLGAMFKRPAVNAARARPALPPGPPFQGLS